MTPEAVFAAVTILFILVFAFIALAKLVAAVVGVSLEFTRILVVTLLIVAVNVPAVPEVPPIVIVLTCAIGTGAVV